MSEGRITQLPEEEVTYKLSTCQTGNKMKGQNENNWFGSPI